MISNTVVVGYDYTFGAIQGNLSLLEPIHDANNDGCVVTKQSTRINRKKRAPVRASITVLCACCIAVLALHCFA